jgi:hypothetical protein
MAQLKTRRSSRVWGSVEIEMVKAGFDSALSDYRVIVEGTDRGKRNIFSDLKKWRSISDRLLAMVFLPGRSDPGSGCCTSGVSIRCIRERWQEVGGKRRRHHRRSQVPGCQRDGYEPVDGS